MRRAVTTFFSPPTLPLPLPLPFAPELMVIQPARLEATQLHPLTVLTLTLSLPPGEPYDALVAESEYVQGDVPA